MNLSAWSIRNPVPALMAFVLLTFAGVLSFDSMKVQNFPDLDLPTITVSASLPGASPAQLETDVARKIENSIATLQAVKHIHTRVQDGGVTITTEFRLEKPVQEALDDVRSAVSRVRADLPGDMRDPVVTKLDLAGQPVLAYTISSTRMDDEALSWFVDNTVTRTLLSVHGVGAVARVGGATREMSIALDPAKLQALGTSAAEVSRRLRLTQQESAGGRTDLGGGEQPVRTLGTVQTAAELGAMELSLSDGRRVRLDQIASVADTVAERRSAALLDGKPVVGFEVSRSRGASEVEVGAGVRETLRQLRLTRPDITLTEAFDFATPVKEEYHGSLWLLAEGAILAVIVVWLFLRDWRATFVSAVALPLSVIPAFIGMHALGFSVNVVTLLALSLVVGILVDDAIVEVENIVRHLKMGKTPYQAAMEAADEIGLAVIATTFTLIAVFLPTAFMSGIPGKFFKQFGWTASLAVLASLLVARMLTPMMAAYMLKATGAHTGEGVLMRGYTRLASWCLDHRILTMLLSAAFFAGSLMLIPLLPTGFIPPDDMSQTQVHVELQPGATLAQTEAAAERARELVSGVQHVRGVYTTIGGGAVGADPFTPQGMAEVRKATLTIRLSERGDRAVKKQVVEEHMREALAALPGARIKVGLGGSGEKYVMVLVGDDPLALAEAARAVEKDLRTIPGIGSIASSAALVRPELAVRPDFARAADLGVTTAAIGETLRIATVGDYDVSLPKVNLAERQVPVVVRLPASARQDLATLERLAVPGSRPGAPSVMLGQVATLELSSGPAVIDRYDRSRNVNFEIELSGQPLGVVSEAAEALPSLRNLPPGVRQTTVGDAEVMGELFISFGLAMISGVLCIYVVLVLLFKDVLQPVTILAALPLSLGGAFVALLAADKSFSMPSLIGLIMLMGIATKNSILLVEYAVMARRDHGMSRRDALLDACHKRARPIVMTTVAMGAGMLPIALGSGIADPSFRSPMATAVIGGLITSTLLSLLVIPVVYTCVDDFEHLVRRAWGGLRGQAAREARKMNDMHEIRPGQSIALLKELHILTRDGKMNQDSRRKLKQVYHLCRFIQPLLDEIRKDHPDVRLVDHGAGKSYLGFILYDLFFRAFGGDAHIYGVETRDELVNRSRELAQRLDFPGMSFLNLSVAEATSAAQLPDRIDIVTALHACDTATDDAIGFALARNARFIVLAPCCQAEVAAVLRKNKGRALSGGALGELWRHPLHTREFGSQVTNVLRCLQLEAHGYQVSVTELVGWEHSLKNELIIASQKQLPRERAARRLNEVLQTLGLDELERRFFTAP